MHTFNLGRRSLFGFALASAATAAAHSAAAVPRAASGDLMVIYVGAGDCAPCRTFEAEDMPRWQASALSRTVRFVRVAAPKTSQAFNPRYWPKEAKPFIGVFTAPIVPSFMLVANGRVVATGGGLRNWRQQTLPKLEQLARA